VTHTTRQADPAPIVEIDAVCAEILTELRDLRDMLGVYRETVAEAARYIAHNLVNTSTSPTADPHGHHLALAMALVGGVYPEVEALLNH
jgi:hypothetical protein